MVVEMYRLEFARLMSPIGEITVIAGGRGVCRVLVGRRGLERRGEGLRKARVEGKEGSEALRAARELEGYFSGRSRGFSCRIDTSSGTEFQKRVWDELVKIPYGEVVTYGEIARRLGSPRAWRAVGGAVASNPLPIIVPCHRVIARGGGGKPSLGGYQYGSGVKSRLLEVEGVCLAP